MKPRLEVNKPSSMSPNTNFNNYYQKSMVKCTKSEQNRTCEMGLLWETGDQILDKCSIVHIRPIYKLATKLLKVKTNH